MSSPESLPIDPLLAGLKAQLQQVAALDADTWLAVASAAHRAAYAAGRAVHLESGGLIYVGDGLMKQYARPGRTQPAINRFIAGGGLLAVPYDADSYYVKTIQPTTLFYWGELTLRQLLCTNPTLLQAYMKLRDGQEALLDARFRILEQRGTAKLVLMDQLFKGLRAQIKGKDLANFVHLAYGYVSQIKDK